jgi:hypothetical protein
VEIHKYTDIIGLDCAEDMYEGRMVWFDAFGAHLPTNAAQARMSRYVVAWVQNNIEPPIYSVYPTYAHALRHGFDQASNLPWAATVYTTYPGLQDECPGQVIASGADVLLYEHGEYSVGSGCWVYDPTAAIGDELEACTTAGFEGMPQLLAQGTPLAVITGISTTGTLRFRTYGD